jgi:hypothetical protein
MEDTIKKSGLIFMKVGLHAQESIEDIIKRKQREFEPTFRTLSVTLKYLTLKALTGKGYAILVQMNYLRLIENNLILLR